MKLDFNESNILVQALADLERNPKVPITKVKLIEELYALGINTDKKLSFLRVSVRSLIKKIENLSDSDIQQIVIDNKNNVIVASVCYELPSSKTP